MIARQLKLTSPECVDDIKELSYPPPPTKWKRGQRFYITSHKLATGMDSVIGLIADNKLWGLDQRKIPEVPKERWFLTHIPTGKQVTNFETQKQAKELVDFMHTLPVDWLRTKYISSKTEKQIRMQSRRLHIERSTGRKK